MTTANNLHNTFIVYKIVRMLAQPWEQFDAYKLGIIDDTGKLLKKPSTKKERESYDILTRMIVNLKRLSQKIPGGTFANYAAALYLIRENYDMDDDDITLIAENLGIDLSNLSENTDNAWLLNDKNCLIRGSYKLANDVFVDGYTLCRKGSTVIVSNSAFGDIILNECVYEVYHPSTGLNVYVSIEDITR